MMMMMMKEKEAVSDHTGSDSAASRGSTRTNGPGVGDSPSKMIIPSSIPHHVLMPVGLDLEIDDIDNYQDIRIELNATGHNLVCMHIIVSS